MLDAMKLPEKDVSEFVDLHGFASTEELAERFSVSEMTVRRCLLRLEDQGQIMRVRAGAIPGRQARTHGRGFVDNLYRARNEKQQIALRAVEIIRGARTVFLDTGSTCYFVARLIPENVGLTVITHSLDVVAALRDKAGVRVVCPGGELDSNLNVFAGPHAERIIESFTADFSLLGTGALDIKMGTQENTLVQIPIKSIMNKNSARSFLLLDSSKFGRRSYFSGIPIDNITDIITTERTENRYIQDLRSIDITVDVVSVPEDELTGDQEAD